MRVRTPAAVPVLLTLALACAPERVQRRPAHAAFGAPAFDEVWRRSVRTLEERGYTIQIQEKTRGLLVSGIHTFPIACPAGTCPARERVAIRLTGNGEAVVDVIRERWESKHHRWMAATDRESVALIEKAQRDILKDAVGGLVVLRKGGDGEPCITEDECVRGYACWLHRCTLTCSNNDACPEPLICSSPGGGVCERWGGAGGASFLGGGAGGAGPR